VTTLALATFAAVPAAPSGARARAGAMAPVFLAAALLCWPALVNGYPLVFSDTGTYLSQAIEHYLGWDRPPFYSLFLFALHVRLTTWPVVAAQALLCAHTLFLLCRALRPDAGRWAVVPVSAILSLGTSLPWLASQLMPDVFTAPLVIALFLLCVLPERLSPRERLWLVLFATGMIAAHLSHLPLALALILVLLPLQRRLGGAPPGRRDARVLLAPAMAMLALAGVNLAGHGRAALAPYGNIFLLSRVIYDGPGADALRADCPAAGWRLCRWADALPATADEFLWQPTSPLIRAGGAKVESSEADAIIRAAVLREPLREARAMATNALAQFVRFGTGDGLVPWPDTVLPWLARGFPPREVAEFEAGLQMRGRLDLPLPLLALHEVLAVLGMLGVLAGLWRGRTAPLRGFCLAVLLALAVNAAVTGALSGPHDRYQSRIVWLAPLAALLAWSPRRAGDGG
jgi:hypothetical protein